MPDAPLIIFSPGPANISPRVRAALGAPDIGHRDEDFTALLARIRGRLRGMLRLPPEYEIVLFTGSATAAIESLLAAAGTLGPVLVLANGAYGERAAEILATYHLPVLVQQHEWGAPLDRRRLETTLGDGTVASVYVVHHETTTGVLNPLPEIAAVVKRAGRRLLVDGVSSIAGEVVDIAGWEIAGITGSANKCLRSAPGIAFAVVHAGFVSAVRAQGRRVSYYTDLLAHLDAEAKGLLPFTPAVPAAFALDEALREWEEEGVESRLAHYRRVADRLRAGLRELGLSLLLSADQLSATMTPVRFPPGISYQDLHAPLKARGFLIYPAMGPLASIMFRLGTVGHYGEEEIDRFLAALADVLASRGALPERGRKPR